MHVNRGKKELSQWIKWGILHVLSPYFLLGTDTIENISLIESAAAFSFKPSPKCLLEKIGIITGEEAEHNVLEVCILCIALSGIKLRSTETTLKIKAEV